MGRDVVEVKVSGMAEWIEEGEMETSELRNYREKQALGSEKMG